MRQRLLCVVARDTAIVLLAVGATLVVFRDNPADLHRRDERDRELIRQRYEGSHGERIVEITMVKPGEFDVLRETKDGKGVRFRVTKSGSNWLRPVPDPD